MVFYPPSWVASLPDPPDSITLEEFINNEQYGRHPLAQSRSPYTCGITGKTHSAAEVARRTDRLARGIGKVLGFDVSEGTEWDRVVGLFSVNTIDYIPLTHAVHRLSGIVTPASAAYSAEELEHQLRSSGAKALFTCVPLLDTARKAAAGAGIPEDKIFLLPVPGSESARGLKTVDDLVTLGETLPAVPKLQWIQGQGTRQTAYLCYSSGTSGMPKAVMISHRNVIANILQMRTFDAPARAALGVNTQPSLGVLPFSHIYGLTIVALLGHYRGDEVVVLPRFELATLLRAVQRFRIAQMFVVPPILIQMMQQQDECTKYDLGSVRSVYCGAAPLGRETAEAVKAAYPKWNVAQGYGMTESSPVVVSSSELDIAVGSSGSLMPGAKVKIIDVEGNEVTAHDQRGEMLVQSPTIVLGYLNNAKASAETFVWHEDGRWLRTGDEVLVRKSDQGHEHFYIVDRIKELIKVKGHQVAPAELEAHLLAHAYVFDCAVISVHDDRAGEAPKAIVVRDAKATEGKKAADVAAALAKHVEEHKARHKWLRGGVEFVDAIPKSASGKILRRLLRDRERERRRKDGAKL